MSAFGVTVETVATITPHGNADKLELLHLQGIQYQFVVGKGTFAVGQGVLYFPLDALIPNELAARLGLPVKEDKPYRLKTVRLRGEWSEGFVTPLDVVGLDPHLALAGADYAAGLGVTKYEPQEIAFRTSNEDLQALPIGVQVYDIENAQRWESAFNALAAQPVVITEKLEGSHWWAQIDRDGRIHVGQRRYEIRNPNEIQDAGESEFPAQPKTMHPFWKAFYDQNLDTYLYWLGREYPGYTVTIRGEIIGEGIQGNYYGIKGRLVYLFEIEVNHEPVDALTFLNLTGWELCPALRVPLLWVGEQDEGTLSDFCPTADDLVKYALGTSNINIAKLREGVVVKPLTEMYDKDIGRLMLKVREPNYLAQ